MNVSIIKALSLPGFVTDAEIQQLCTVEPVIGAVASEVCVGAEGLSKPLMRIAGIDQSVDGMNGVVLSTPDGRPVAVVHRKYHEQGNPVAFHALHSYIRERGSARHEVTSTRPSYVIKKVRERLNAILDAKSSRHSNMYGSTIGQVLQSLFNSNVTNQTVEVKADKLMSLLDAIKSGSMGVVGTAVFDDLYAKCDAVTKARSLSRQRAKDEIVDRKWWYVVNHGDYGFALYKTHIMNPTVTPDVVLGWSNGGTVAAHTVMEHQGWFKSLDHMQQAAPELYQEFYVQLVMTKQMTQSLRSTNPYVYQPIIESHVSMFGGTVAEKPSPLQALLPNGDFYYPESGLASWTYTARDAKTGSYTLLERI